MALTFLSKLVIISITTLILILSTFTTLKFSITQFSVTQLPILYTSLLPWNNPPYLYLFINCIIISILASSKIHLPNHYQPFSPPDPVIMSGAGGGMERSGSLEFLVEGVVEEEKDKPLVSQTFVHEKSLEASNNINDGANELSPGTPKPNREETMESTWKMIMEKHEMPLNRQLNKSETWTTHVAHEPTVEKTAVVKKFETFNETNKLRSSRAQGKLKREPSLSQDELNRRVEAFINKFNEEMRLQRQQSLNQIGGQYHPEIFDTTALIVDMSEDF